MRHTPARRRSNPHTLGFEVVGSRETLGEVITNTPIAHDLFDEHQHPIEAATATDTKGKRS